MMLSSLSDSKSGPDTHQEEGGSDRSSFSRIFTYFLIIFFIFQVATGIAVIVLFIGGEMSNMQMFHIESELDNRKHTLESYLEDRLLLLEEYSELPIIIAGTMDPTGNLANTVDFIADLHMLEGDAFFSLQDFQGNIIYSVPKISIYAPQGDVFQDLMDGKSGYVIDIVRPAKTDPDCCYWRLSVPVKYQGSSEGVLSAFIPISLDRFLISGSINAVRIAIEMDGDTVISMGEVPLPAVTLQMKTRFPGIGLVQEVSKQEVNERVEFLIKATIIALVLGASILFVIIQLVGRKLFIVPHTRLQAMSDGLEREVGKRTADLQKRTVQLSVEIQERRDAEMEARETGSLVTGLLEGIGAAFFIINPKTGSVVRSNSVARTMFGLSPMQLSDKSCDEIFSKASDIMADLVCPSGIKGNTYTEGISHHIDGHSFPVSRYLVPMELKGEEHIGVIMLDIAERKNLERRLNIAQKLESVGELASGIAHEINTPIQYVGDSIRFVKDAFGDIIELLKVEAELVGKCREAGLHPDIVGKIEEISGDADLEFVLEEIPKACLRALEGTDRVAVIVRAMKNFAHPGDGEKSSVDINQALENTILVSKNEWKYVADVVNDFGSLPLVQCLPGDINQVFLNVLVNAAHAIGDVVGNSGEKGTITISTEASDHEVIVRIADTGAGVPLENREKLFDPFFTTKEVGRGTGQGLAIVHDIIVERHGGSIDFASEMGKGTTFIIGLPLSTE